MSSLAISVPQFSAERRALAIFKLVTEGSVQAAIKLTFTYLLHYQRIGQDEFGRRVSAVAEEMLPMFAAVSAGAQGLTFRDCERLVWAALLLGRQQDLHNLVPVLFRKRGAAQLPAIRARFVPHSSQIESQLQIAGVPDIESIFAELQFQSGETSAALEAYDQILAESPYDWDALYGRALIHQERGNYDSATQDLRVLFERYVETGRGYVVLCEGMPVTYFPFTQRGLADAVVRAVELKYPDEGGASTETVIVELLQADQRMTIFEFAVGSQA